ncbi:RES family NAD+ phosphorylase [Tabrizicola sp.]|uniref:RES family NAD+ phosphorylase n=1 Tax=Tabrizicola sp. TaxID=2005166 RepID=UPI003F2E21C8
MRLWRLTKAQFLPGLDGEGARLAGGRWNNPGMPVVYCSSSLALAALEALVNIPSFRRRRGELQPLVAVALEVDEEAIADSGFPIDQDIGVSRQMGDAWLRSGSSFGLMVPSRVIPLERNVLLNPRHPAMSEVTIALTEPFIFDDRLGF